MRNKREFTDYQNQVKEYYELEYCEYSINWEHKSIEDIVFESWDKVYNIQKCCRLIKDFLIN